MNQLTVYKTADKLIIVHNWGSHYPKTVMIEAGPEKWGEETLNVWDYYKSLGYHQCYNFHRGPYLEEFFTREFPGATVQYIEV